MSSSTLIRYSRRWLPLLILLLALAQLATATHQHADEQRIVDCGLCLQHSGLKHLHGGYSLPQLPVITGFHPAPTPMPTGLALPVYGTKAIRAPPLSVPPSLA